MENLYSLFFVCFTGPSIKTQRVYIFLIVADHKVTSLEEYTVIDIATDGKCKLSCNKQTLLTVYWDSHSCEDTIAIAFVTIRYYIVLCSTK